MNCSAPSKARGIGSSISRMPPTTTSTSSKASFGDWLCRMDRQPKPASRCTGRKCPAAARGESGMASEKKKASPDVARAHRPIKDPPKEQPPRPRRDPPDGDAPVKDPPEETPA